jgi:hypothetical protein
MTATWVAAKMQIRGFFPFDRLRVRMTRARGEEAECRRFDAAAVS